MSLQVNGLSKAYQANGGRLKVLDGLNLSVRQGEFVSLIGPSGCGKSTLFNLISGLERPSAGNVILKGREVTGTTGNVSYMMQKDGLLPWRTVVENAVLGSEVAGQPRKPSIARVKELLPVFGLSEFADAYPDTLSGGMRQRVALLRTVMTGKDVWLLDEPFGALDALTRDHMQEWLLDICRRFQPTVLFITHSIDEAVYLSDRTVVLDGRPARIVEDLPIDLPRPRTREMQTLATFVGHKRRLMQNLFHQE
ncbi:MAG TPA: ABC transporter ATP-binding protein [Bacillales bacterium]|nr:ABC transporter ATP-binding protein [Bacillales bacterium]